MKENIDILRLKEAGKKGTVAARNLKNALKSFIDIHGWLKEEVKNEKKY